MKFKLHINIKISRKIAFLGESKPNWVFILRINVTISTAVGILTLLYVMNRINFVHRSESELLTGDTSSGNHSLGPMKPDIYCVENVFCTFAGKKIYIQMDGQDVVCERATEKFLNMR